MESVSNGHPIRQMFSGALDRVFNNDFGLDSKIPVKTYLEDLLIKFMASPETVAPKNRFGQPVLNLQEMLEEADITLWADSFERERQIHQHIGDYLLFWTGMFPEGYPVIQAGVDRLIEPVNQARTSYEIVSQFDHPPHEEAARLFLEFSQNFEAYQFGLRLVSQQLRAA